MFCFIYLYSWKMVGPYVNEFNKPVDFILFHKENACDCVIEEEPNMKSMIEYVTTNDKKTKCCGICYNSDAKFIKCTECNFFVCYNI